MHSIAPYSIRCFNPRSGAKNFDEKFLKLDKVGQFDLYQVFKSFLGSQDDKYRIIEKTKQVYKFFGVKFYDEKREIAGWFEAGTYGVKNDIVDIDTGNVDYEKTQQHSVITKHYVRISLPAGVNEGIALLHNYKGNGIKTLLHDLLRQHLQSLVQVTLQMNPLAYQEAFKQWRKAHAKEIRLTKFSGAKDITDQIAGLGHKEQQLVIKAHSRGALGTFEDFFLKGTKEKSIVEFLDPVCEQVKAVFDLDGKRRTFNVGRSMGDQFCEISLDDDDVDMIAGNPEPKSLHRYCSKVLSDLSKSIYPGI
ncbi:hypothetical protein [Pseudomonas asiatica]|uniref:hypothetical protein n=1 Tax=Pseudomonas asiatica TaxID=2219225 RepID=UPI00174E99AE|nr:hypothetical protein [Pseudomonas asiatica]QOE10706.1 hypothetical protein IE322_11885 [Pseudomonas asiatica]